jgi:hypothetical protein
MFNDTMQGKAKHIGIIMGGTPESIDDTRRGAFSYEALKSRLEEGKFGSTKHRDLLAPIIRLRALSNEEMLILAEKIRDIHASLHDYETTITENDLMDFIRIEFSRVGANENITPREINRDFIKILNILYQNPKLSISEMLENNSVDITKDIIRKEDVEEDFAEFLI